MNGFWIRTYAARVGHRARATKESVMIHWGCLSQYVYDGPAIFTAVVPRLAARMHHDPYVHVSRREIEVERNMV